jgi:hypothetical protein
LYDFLEAPPNSNSWPLNALSSLVYTNRTINSTFSCNSYTVNPVTGNGSSSLIDVFLNGTGEPSTAIAVPSVATNETTFFLDNGTCGSRCGFISVFQASFTTPQFYQCNIPHLSIWSMIHLHNWRCIRSPCELRQAGVITNDIQKTQITGFLSRAIQTLWESKSHTSPSAH